MHERGGQRRLSGMVNDSALSQVAGAGNDLRATWKAQLEGEGGRAPGRRSSKDLTFGFVGAEAVG